MPSTRLPIAFLAAALALAPAAQAHQLPDYAAAFGDRDAAFVVVDATTGAEVVRWGRHARRLTPCSTFKVPLALLAHDRGLIDDRTVFRWDGTKQPIESWNQDQTPASWLVNSPVWVSQQLTPRLGRATLGQTLRAYGFGDADVSGDLTGFWLTTHGRTSLRISADEQVAFYRKLHAGTLPARPAAQAAVRRLLVREAGAQGDVLMGKTGSGRLKDARGRLDGRQVGWWVGLAAHGGRTYAVACNFTDRAPGLTEGPAGFTARKLARAFLTTLGLFSPADIGDSGTGGTGRTAGRPVPSATPTG